MLATILQRSLGMSSSTNWVRTVVIIIAVIIGGGLLVWALKLAITNFLPAELQPKAIAVMYIVIAIALAVLVFHWAGLF
jgi:hypothetical protein